MRSCNDRINIEQDCREKRWTSHACIYACICLNADKERGKGEEIWKPTIRPSLRCRAQYTLGQNRLFPWVLKGEDLGLATACYPCKCINQESDCYETEGMIYREAEIGSWLKHL